MCLCLACFFFKQKTAYERRISDWSSDVFSADLVRRHPIQPRDQPARGGAHGGDCRGQPADADPARKCAQDHGIAPGGDRGARGGAEIYIGSIGNAGSGPLSDLSETVEITNQRGLHARASAKFITFVSRLPETRSDEHTSELQS